MEENSLQKLKKISNSFKYEGVITQKIKSFEQFAEKLIGLAEQSKKKQRKQSKSHGGKKNGQKGDKVTNRQ